MQDRALSLPVPPRNRHTHKPLKAKIAGMTLVSACSHNKYGIAILLRNDLKIVIIYEKGHRTADLIPIVMHGVVVHSVFKLPNYHFELPAVGHRDGSHRLQRRSD